MYPLTPSELGDDFDLDTALQWRTIPLVWVSDERDEVLESYVQLSQTGLRAVAELPGIVRRVLVYGGRRSFSTQDGIDVWSVERLHRTLAEDTCWP